jgi:hypothetical protein
MSNAEVDVNEDVLLEETIEFANARGEMILLLLQLEKNACTKEDCVRRTNPRSRDFIGTILVMVMMVNG